MGENSGYKTTREVSKFGKTGALGASLKGSEKDILSPKAGRQHNNILSPKASGQYDTTKFMSPRSLTKS